MGVAVVGVAVAAAVTIGGPILIGMAVGAVIGAAAGSIIGGVSSKMSGGSFLDGFSDGFMWGAIGGAASGALDGAGLGLAGIATGNGLVSSSIYAGQTLVNGGHVTAAGLATSFGVGAGMSVLGSAVSGKISEVVSKDVAEGVSESLTDGVGKANLAQETIHKIKSTPKGQRPDPSTYLTEDYIEQHLSQFEDGGAYVMTRDQYDMYVDGKLNIGREDNTLFITSKGYLDEIGTKANGDLSVFEEKLGFEEGHFQDGGGLVRIDIKNPSEFNVRIPSGNEAGANEYFIPGGYTSGGTPEAVVNNIPNNDEFRTIRFLGEVK